MSEVWIAQFLEHATGNIWTVGLNPSLGMDKHGPLNHIYLASLDQPGKPLFPNLEILDSNPS